MKTMLRCLVVPLFMIALSASNNAWAVCGGEDKDICLAWPHWAAANVVSLTITNANEGRSSRSTLIVDDPINLTLVVDRVFRGQPEHGTIKVVEGRVMLTRGLTLEKGYEIDALDGPILYHQLAIILLAHSIISGPDQLNGTQSINIDERKRTLRAATMSASINIPPPWKLKGLVSRKSLDTIDFSLQLAFEGNGATSTMSFDGSWQKLDIAPQTDPSMLLADWRLYPLGVVVTNLNDNSGENSAGGATPTSPTTIGELRESIRSGTSDDSHQHSRGHMKATQP